MGRKEAPGRTRCPRDKPPSSAQGQEGSRHRDPFWVGKGAASASRSPLHRVGLPAGAWSPCSSRELREQPVPASCCCLGLRQHWGAERGAAGYRWGCDGAGRVQQDEAGGEGWEVGMGSLGLPVSLPTGTQQPSPHRWTETEVPWLPGPSALPCWGRAKTHATVPPQRQAGEVAGSELTHCSQPPARPCGRGSLGDAGISPRRGQSPGQQQQGARRHQREEEGGGRAQGRVHLVMSPPVALQMVGSRPAHPPGDRCRGLPGLWLHPE